ncbi:hypothetical protein PV326_009822 [Microctonus aethiopoides]|nr:hypothetical protein PV326_009822 [Microctonus aethiopoides]
MVQTIPANVMEGYYGSFRADDAVGVVFTSDKLLGAIGDFGTSEIFIDGTFDARPKSPASAQLLVMHVKMRDTVRCSSNICSVRQTDQSFLQSFLVVCRTKRAPNPEYNNDDVRFREGTHPGHQGEFSRRAGSRLLDSFHPGDDAAVKTRKVAL